jgi:23S rRNA (guanosine2251-2'-O)-methyltransferase
MVAILHNIRSIHNVGSIFRTADAAGLSKIYLSGITPTPIDRFGRPVQKLNKVALGAENYVTWEYSANTLKLIDKLQGDNWTILALEQSKHSISIWQAKYNKREKKKLALLVGNEVKGLAPSLLSRADEIVEIPMYGQKESLNVAVAFGVAVFALVK